MNTDLVTQTIRDIFEKNTIDNNPFSTITDVSINFIETKQFHDKMVVDVEYIGSKHFFIIVCTEEDLGNLPLKEGEQSGT